MEQQIMDLGHEWAEAELHGDTEYLARLLTDDFLLIGPLGFMLTKEQALARFQSGDLGYTALSWSDVAVRVYGDAAIATGRHTQQGTYQGRPIDGQFRVTQVSVRQEKRWQLAGLHFSPIAQSA